MYMVRHDHPCVKFNPVSLSELAKMDGECRSDVLGGEVSTPLIARSGEKRRSDEGVSSLTDEFNASLIIHSHKVISKIDAIPDVTCFAHVQRIEAFGNSVAAAAATSGMFHAKARDQLRVPDVPRCERSEHREPSEPWTNQSQLEHSVRAKQPHVIRSDGCRSRFA
jgi:hypothetical protein